jgi:hypothetical protein
LLHDVLPGEIIATRFEHARFDAVARLPPYCPGKVLRIVPLVGAGGNEQLRHLVLVQVLSDRAVGGRTECLEKCQHPVLFDQLANLFESLWRAITVVTPVDAAVLIYARHILKNFPDAQIAVLYQNDDYGKDYLIGLREGLGDKAEKTLPGITISTSASDFAPIKQM